MSLQMPRWRSEESQYRVSNLRARLAAEPETTPVCKSTRTRTRPWKKSKRDWRPSNSSGIGCCRISNLTADTFATSTRRYPLARERLAELQEAERGSIDGTEINPIHQELTSELLRAEAQLEGARGSSNSLQTQVAELQRELDDLNERRSRSSDFVGMPRPRRSRTCCIARNTRRPGSRRRWISRRLINVTVAQPAQRPLRPVSRESRSSLLLAALLCRWCRAGSVSPLVPSFTLITLLPRARRWSVGWASRIWRPFPEEG